MNKCGKEATGNTGRLQLFSTHEYVRRKHLKMLKPIRLTGGIIFDKGKHKAAKKQEALYELYTDGT